jgi:hypothetical protein
LLLLVAVKLLQNKVPLKAVTDNSVILSALFLVAVWISYACNGIGNAKSTNHVVAYTSSFLLFFIGVTFALGYVDASFKRKILQAIVFITVFSSAFTVIEFIIKNVAGYDINQLIPRVAVQDFGALALSEFFRARGFAEESGHFALFLEVLSPVCLYYLFFSGYSQMKLHWKVVAVFIIFIAWICVLSPLSFILVPVAYIGSLILFFTRIGNKKRVFNIALMIGGALLGFLLILNIFLPITDIFYLSVIQKLDSSSFQDRGERMDFFYEYFPKGGFVHMLIGYGPAAFAVLGFDDSKSILSLYHSITFEIGLVGLFLLLSVFASIFFRILQLKTREGFFMMVAFISAAVHYYFVANYWFPWIWFLFALVIYFSGNRDKQIVVEEKKG